MPSNTARHKDTSPAPLLPVPALSDNPHLIPSSFYILQSRFPFLFDPQTQSDRQTQEIKKICDSVDNAIVRNNVMVKQHEKRVQEGKSNQTKVSLRARPITLEEYKKYQHKHSLPRLMKVVEEPSSRQSKSSSSLRASSRLVEEEEEEEGEMKEEKKEKEEEEEEDIQDEEDIPFMFVLVDYREKDCLPFLNRRLCTVFVAELQQGDVSFWIGNSKLILRVMVWDRKAKGDYIHSRNDGRKKQQEWAIRFTSFKHCLSGFVYEWYNPGRLGHHAEVLANQGEFREELTAPKEEALLFTEAVMRAAEGMGNGGLGVSDLSQAKMDTLNRGLLLIENATFLHTVLDVAHLSLSILRHGNRVWSSLQRDRFADPCSSFDGKWSQIALQKDFLAHAQKMEGAKVKYKELLKNPRSALNRMLSVLSGMSQDKANPICDKYPTMLLLCQAYLSLDNRMDQEALVQDLLTTGTSGRRVGSALSKSLFHLLGGGFDPGKEDQEEEEEKGKVKRKSRTREEEKKKKKKTKTSKRPVKSVMGSDNEEEKEQRDKSQTSMHILEASRTRKRKTISIEEEEDENQKVDEEEEGKKENDVALLERIVSKTRGKKVFKKTGSEKSSDSHESAVQSEMDSLLGRSNTPLLLTTSSSSSATSAASMWTKKKDKSLSSSSSSTQKVNSKLESHSETPNEKPKKNSAWKSSKITFEFRPVHDHEEEKKPPRNEPKPKPATQSISSFFPKQPKTGRLSLIAVPPATKNKKPKRYRPPSQFED